MGGRGSSSQSSSAAGVAQQFRQLGASYNQDSKSLEVTRSIDMANAAADLVDSGEYRQLMSSEGFKAVQAGLRRVYGDKQYRASAELEKVLDPRLRSKPVGVSQEVFQDAVSRIQDGMAAVERAGFDETDVAALVRFKRVFSSL